MSKTKRTLPDATYGPNCIRTDDTPEALKRLCQEYVGHLTVNEAQQQAMAIRTVAQCDDPSGECARERHGRLTASHFGEIYKQRADYAPLTIRLLYNTTRSTPAMRYGILHEGEAREQYTQRFKDCHPGASVTTTGLHVDIKV